MLKKLGKYLKGLGFLAFLSALGMIVESICELALPSLANNIYETVNVATTPEDAKAYVLKMGFAMLGLACIGLCGGIGTMKASAGLAAVAPAATLLMDVSSNFKKGLPSL